jgi:hypothetical protein
VLPFVLSVVGFLFGSIGAALVVLGHHLCDEVEIGNPSGTKPKSESCSAWGGSDQHARQCR